MYRVSYGVTIRKDYSKQYVHPREIMDATGKNSCEVLKSGSERLKLPSPQRDGVKRRQGQKKRKDTNSNSNRMAAKPHVAVRTRHGGARAMINLKSECHRSSQQPTSHMPSYLSHLFTLAAAVRYRTHFESAVSTYCLLVLRLERATPKRQ